MILRNIPKEKKKVTRDTEPQRTKPESIYMEMSSLRPEEDLHLIIPLYYISPF
jgi:hypothetical protein